jgi:hypothetical protein
MRESWVTVAAVTAVFGFFDGVAYLEGASVAIALDGLRNVAEMEHRQLRVCADRFGLVAVLVDAIGLTVLSYLTWRRWRRCVIALVFLFLIQVSLVASAFELRQGVLITVMNGAGRVIKRCLCY